MLTFTLLSLAHAATWTVDPSGGGDATTIAAGVALLSEGDTLFVSPGTYDVQYVDVMPDDVTIDGAGWESTVFDGSLGDPLSSTGYGLMLVGQDVTVRGIGFQGYVGDTAQSAVRVKGSATFEGCAFVGNFLGVRATYYDVPSIAIYSSLFAENVVGVYTEYYLDTLRVESSLFVDNNYGLLFEDYTNPGSGEFNLIASVNNTFVGGTRSIQIGGGYGYAETADFEVYIVNNLFLGSQYRWLISLNEYRTPSGEIRNNVYSSSTVSKDLYTTLTETDNLEAEPEFVAWSDDGDWTNDDLRLVAGSPGIDAGASGYATWPTDLDGLDRALDGDGDELAQPDAGAYEYCPPELCPPPEPEDTGGADTGTTPPTDTGGSGDGGADDTSPPPGTGGSGTVDRPSSGGLLGCATAPGRAAGAGLALALAALLRRRRPRAACSGRQLGRTLPPR